MAKSADYFVSGVWKNNSERITDVMLHLEQTPMLISTMKKSLKDEDWHLLKATVHKMIPSFSIMGINPNNTAIAKKIQEYATTLEISEEMSTLVLELEAVCTKSCDELQIELINLN